jgi:hypothetical protein
MLLVGLLFYAEHYARQGHRNVEIQTSLLLSFLVGCQLGALFALRRTWPQDKRDKLIVAVAVAASAFWLTNVCLREPAELQIHSARPFAQAVEELRRQQPRRLALLATGKVIALDPSRLTLRPRTPGTDQSARQFPRVAVCRWRDSLASVLSATETLS